MNLVAIDQGASTSQAPYGVITADCSSPREIDDGIFVEQLDAAQELYRVGVCVADTSSLYDDRTIVKQALRNTQARYWTQPDGSRGYEPMIDPEAIRNLEFTEGNVRDALIVSFLVGMHQAPSEVDISFGKVEVRRNLNYKDFGRLCRYSNRVRKFGRASALIIRHLGYNAGGDPDQPPDVDDPAEATYHRLIHVPPEQAWMRGARLNEAYMVAAGHLAAQLVASEGREAIYRVHDPSDETYQEFIPSNIARFSRTPGLHAGLNLDPYCRVTSPLRRLEDFMMSHHLKLRHLGRAATQRDIVDMAAAVQRLNAQVAREFFQGPLRLGRQDALGNGPWRPRSAAQDGAQILTLPQGRQGSAVA